MPNLIRPAGLAKLVLVAMACLPVSHAANATLGGAAESVERDSVHMKALTRSEAAPGYTVHTMTAPSGTAIREYAATGGKVFALTWSGPAMPDLRQLMGNYFSTYAADPVPRRNGHAHRQVNRPELVVRSSGHQRAFSGKAYVPSMVPPGVAIDDLP